MRLIKTIKEIIKEEHTNFKAFVLRRVDWDKVLDGLQKGFDWYERHQENKRGTITLEQYTNIVMSLVMDSIYQDLIDNEGIRYHHKIERYLSSLLADQIEKSYNQLFD